MGVHVFSTNMTCRREESRPDSVPSARQGTITIAKIQTGTVYLLRLTAGCDVTKDFTSDIIAP